VEEEKEGDKSVISPLAQFNDHLRLLSHRRQKKRKGKRELAVEPVLAMG